MSNNRHRGRASLAARLALAGGVAWLALAPSAALAQTSREQQLEQRLAELEAAVQSLRSELNSTRAAQAEVATQAQAMQTQVAATETRVAAVEARPQAPAEGFRVGNSTVRLGGFIRTVAAFSNFDDGVVAANSLGRDFYLPQTIPVGGVSEGTLNDYSAKQSRFWMNIAADVAGHRVAGYVETDFQTATGTQGSERTTNGYNLALRRAYVQVDRLTIGQDWSTFQYTGALPETTDFVGPTEGTVFVRQPLIRYSTPMGQGTTLHLSLENPETATFNQGSATLVENDDDRVPDLAARIHHTGSFGELSLAGVVRQLSVINGTVDDQATGWGVSAGGKIFLNAAHSADVRFLSTIGSGLGRYVGINFAPDAIVQAGTGQLHRVSNRAVLAALRVPLGGNWRTNLMGGWQTVNYPDAFANRAYSASAWSLAGNIFFTPVRGLDVGVEYRHGERELVSGASGQLNRFEFAAKFTF